MRFSKILSGVSVLIGFSTLSGCSDEPYESTQQEQYVKDFISKYGIPDPRHDWTMASTVKTDIKINGLNKGTVEIYTAAPGTPEARLAARIPITGSRAITGSGDAIAEISLPSGMDCAYVQIKDGTNAIRTVSKVSIQQNSMSQTLRVSTPPSNVNLPTKEDYEFQAYFLPTTIREIYKEYVTDHAKDYDGDCSYSAANEWFKTTGREYNPNPANSGWKSSELYPTQRFLTSVPHLKMLSGLYYEMGEALSYRSYLSPIFDHYHLPDSEETADGVFKEGEDNIERYYHNATGGIQLDAKVTFKVDEEGPVTMQCIWRGTEFNDYFGYYYYKPGEVMTADRLLNDIPKYIFLTSDDVKEYSDLTQSKSIKVVSAIDDSGSDSGWTDLNGMSTSNCSSWINHDGDDDRLIRGRKYYLAYYGEDYDQDPSYEFPKDVQIGYFLFRGDKFYFSDCALQYELAYSQYKSEDYGPMGRPYAGKFRMQGRTYVGFGDECGDCDLNDLVFIAENVYPARDITPEELGGPEDEPTPLCWTLACEDLGSTDDVDFNDVVLDVEYVAGSGKITLIPRAAGGTLVTNVYFRQGNDADYTLVGEIHKLMSDEYSSNFTMLNTELDYHHVNPLSVKKITLNVPEDFVMSDFMSRIRLTTRGEDDTEANAKEVTAYTDIAGAGKIPQMLLLSGEWYWPKERTGITIAYPDFTDWVKDSGNTDWIKNRTDEVTVSHRKCKNGNHH